MWFVGDWPSLAAQDQSIGQIFRFQDVAGRRLDLPGYDGGRTRSALALSARYGTSRPAPSMTSTSVAVRGQLSSCRAPSSSTTTSAVVAVVLDRCRCVGERITGQRREHLQVHALTGDPGLLQRLFDHSRGALDRQTKHW